MSEREEWMNLIRNEYDPAPRHYRIGDDWDDGAGRIADAIIADKGRADFGEIKMTEKVKTWWSGDGEWFCMLVNDGVNQSTVSLTPEEAALLSHAADVTPAVQRAANHFWNKANEYDHDKLQAIYNDFYSMQDKVDTVPLSQAMDAVMLALQLIDRLTDPPSSQTAA